jgi:hypothetical protein
MSKKTIDSVRRLSIFRTKTFTTNKIKKELKVKQKV